MNTKDKWTITATIHDPKRCELWGEVFPGARVPIKSIVPIMVRVPECGDVPAYLLDLDALTYRQLDGVITIIVKRLEISRDEVLSEIHLGVPILMDGTSVSSSDQGLIFSTVDDGEEWNRSQILHRYEDGEPEEDEL